MNKHLIFLLLIMITGVQAHSSSTETPSVNNYGFDTPINDKWLYNASTNIYYITGINYCSNPSDLTYQQMGIFVPGQYMNATANGNGTYTCTIDTLTTFNGYKAFKAPIVVPVSTPAYAAQAPPSGYSSTVTTYTNAGFIYLWPGCRGKTHGGPLGVTDLKAAVRYFRYLSAEQHAVPGNTNLIFSFGMSGGGAQSAILGASGNSSLYQPYLTAIGAKSGYTDNICGSMCWCPITNLDLGNGAHEWNMGLTRSALSTADQAISKGIAAEFATYINSVGFKNPANGNTLSLTSTTNGYYHNGSYYSYVVGIINDAISRYNSFQGTSIAPYSLTDTTALNTFVTQYKRATKGLAAYDDYKTKSTPENTVFGIAGVPGHFDKFLAPLINTYASSYYPSFVSDLSATNLDAIGNTVQTRLMMYTPLYYLVNNTTYYSGGGAGSSTVAPYWRIRSGINQSDAPLCTELNLALALQNYNGVRDVDFKTIWAKAHVQAEDTGSAASNFVVWVNKCALASLTSIYKDQETTPTGFTLMQNYPNPFNPSTVIEYGVPERSTVRLELFNSIGESIRVVENGIKEAGSYNIRVDASILPAGMYFYKLTANGFTQTRKMLLVK